MAKAKKKSTAKVAKKKAPKKVKAKSKAKPAAKAKTTAKVKKVVAKPAKKTVKKVTAKKASKKVTTKAVVVPKKSSKVKKEIKMGEKKIVPKVEKIQPTQVSPVAPVAKPAPPQLHMFQMPNQRPIAHKPVKAPAQDSRSRYSEEELKEFEGLINAKLEKAKEEYKILKETLNRNNDEGTDATSGGNTKVLEDGAETAEKENLSQLAARQQKYITNLENALIRIKNGTYGVCSVTGKLISKERLIAVPHTTQSIEAKLMQSE